MVAIVTGQVQWDKVTILEKKEANDVFYKTISDFYVSE